MHALHTVSTYLKGGKLVRLGISRREGGYFFVNSRDLPGFSIMLSPDDAESLDSLATALVKPLEAFINAEFRACMANPAQKARVTGVTHQPNSLEIETRWAPAPV
jgi:hypothetical protein